ncbi:oligosaccharide flippase family protein [Amaricoccus sp. W119]|uniref:oligosaccharide flippase family protein n=1 Tax=Amaricoccus sp. W119 TaxID=3391833 RepID=UPI0039A6DEB4
MAGTGGSASSVLGTVRRSAPLIAVLGVSKLLALLSSVVIARFFDRETSGVIFFVLGIGPLSVAITTFGLAAASSYYYSRNLRRERYGRNWQIFNLSLLVAIPPSVLLGFFALTMEETRGAIGPLIFFVIATSCFAAAVRQMVKMIFTIEHHRDWSIVHDSITYNAVIVLAVVVWSLVRGSRELSLMTGLIAILMASIIACGLAIWHARRQLSDGRGPFAIGAFPRRRYIAVLMAIAIPSMIAQGGGHLLNKVDVVMIGPMAGPVEVGAYSVAMRTSYIAGLLAEVVLIFLAPKLIAIGASGDRVAQWRILKFAMTLQAAALAVVTIPLVIFAEPVIALIFGRQYTDVATTYLILQAGRTLTGLFSPIIALFTALGHSRELARAAVVAAGANVAFNLFLIPLWGAQGAALGTSIALTILFLNYIRLAWRIRGQALAAQGERPG